MKGPATGRPQGSFCINWGWGGGYEISNIPENKTRCGFGLERIKIRENLLVAFLASLMWCTVLTQPTWPYAYLDKKK